MRFFYIPEYISRSDADLPLLQNNYKEFVTSLFTESENTNNLTAFYNQLCFARTELRSLRKDKQIKQINQYIPIKKFYKKALELADTQLKLVEIKIRVSFKNQSEEEEPPNKIKSKIKWTGSIYELVELGYAILATKSVNNGEVDIKELMEFLCSIFDFEAKNFYHAYTTIRHRAGDRTIYLNRLKEKLMEKMEEADNRKLRIG
ncbi:MAG: RteC domain-containing protein [Bacteroidetes bacterium]|nr:RteC domain-containing protein [Bacteroidota bacterium]